MRTVSAWWQEPVEDGGSKGAVVVEDFGQFLNGAVGSNHYGTLLIALADDLEEQIGTGLCRSAKILAHPGSRPRGGSIVLSSAFMRPVL